MRKITLATSILLFGVIAIKAQYGDAYHKANQEEIRKATQQRQQAQSDQHFKNIAPSNTKSSAASVLPTSTSTYSPYAAEHQAKMDAYNRKVQEKADAWEAKERKFAALSANVPKNEENYRKLVALAEEAGFEYYDALRLNSSYKPKIESNTAENKQEQSNQLYKLLQGLNK